MFSTSFRGYDRDEVETHFAQVKTETQHLLGQLAALRQSLEEAKLEAQTATARAEEAESKRSAAETALGQMVAEVERLRMELDGSVKERDELKERVEGLQQEESASREILRAAQKTAEEMRANARQEAESMVRTAEERVSKIEADGRERQKELDEQFERMRAEFDKFLSKARSLASGFVREIDEVRE
ncbi:MAG: DivIVA domain-containing protein [Chthonomonadaceae bacterium]|nr:DivIVA domain-containing protein [Chthonomonadaceae bacterium]